MRYYYSNQGLTALPLLTDATELFYQSNQLVSLSEYPNLTKLHCVRNRLTVLRCANNQLTSLVEYPKLVVLSRERTQ